MSDLATVGLPFLGKVEQKFYVHETCRTRKTSEPRCGFVYLASHLLSRTVVQVELPGLMKGVIGLREAVADILKWLDGNGNCRGETHKTWLNKGHSLARGMRGSVLKLLPTLMNAHVLETMARDPASKFGKKLKRVFGKVKTDYNTILTEDVAASGKQKKIRADFIRAGDVLDELVRLLDEVSAKKFDDHVREACNTHLNSTVFKGVTQNTFEKKLRDRVGEVVMTSGLWHESFFKVFL